MWKAILFLIISPTCFANTDLYSWTEAKMKEVFELTYQEDITLESITYVLRWSEHIDNLDCSNGLHGMYTSLYNKEDNKIYVHDSNTIDPIYRKSVLVHELAHFFTKKAIWKPGDQYYPIGFVEAIAYYIQDLWLKEHGHKGIIHYQNVNIEDHNIIPSFEYNIDMWFMMARHTFLYNVVELFKTDAPKKFQNFENGWYTMRGQYR